MKKYFYIIFIFIGFSCKPTLDETIVSFDSGETELTNVIYIGDNLLSGFQNGGLYKEAQENSLAVILATQFMQVGGIAVEQPLMPEGSGSTHLSVESYKSGTITAEWVTENSDIIATNSITNLTCTGDSTLVQYSKFTDVITNYAIPNMRVSDISSATMGVINSENYNPYFERINTNDETYYNIIKNTTASFYISSFGFSDILAKAQSGWSCDDITSSTIFNSKYKTLLNLFKEKELKGALIEIPSLENLPFLNAKFTSDKTIFIEAKQNYVDVYEIRAYKDGDQFLRKYLTLIGVDGYGITKENPILNKHVIDVIEKDDIAADIDKYNLHIRNLATSFNLALVDMSNYVLQETGSKNDAILLNGVNTTIDYTPGSAISLDGYSPTPRGAAAIANKCIDAINAKYEAKIPLVDINNYPGLQL